jgi:3-hydroxyisobutyrate dehydrogenase
MHYGYIGLGNLGAAIWRAACVKAGFEVTVYDLNPALADALVALGARGADSAEAWRRGWTMSSPACPVPAVSEACCAELLPGLKPGRDLDRNVDPGPRRGAAAGGAGGGRAACGCWRRR